MHSGEQEGPSGDGGKVLSWVRSHGSERLRVVLNMTGRRVRRPELVRGEPLFGTHPDLGGQLAPYEGRILCLD